MAQVTLKGNPVNTIGNLPEKGNKIPDFTAVYTDLSEIKLSDYAGKNVILNIFPSVDTSTCAASVHRFNQEIGKKKDTVVLCLSKDLPFAHKRFCESEGIDNVINASLFRNSDFGKNLGVEQVDGPLKGLMARSIVVLDKNGNVVHTELVSEITEEPDYESALEAVS